MDDDDDFLYGGSSTTDNIKQPTSVPQPPLLEKTTSSNGLNDLLDAEVDYEHSPDAQAVGSGEQPQEEDQEDDDERVDFGEDTDEEDDIEIIMEPTARSLDFRQSTAGRGIGARPTVPTPVAQPKGPQPSLTTEYTPIQRGGSASIIPPSTSTPQTQIVPPQPTTAQLQSTTIVQPQPQSYPQPPLQQQLQPPQLQHLPSQSSTDAETNGIDTLGLPPVTAPPSHPSIDPSAVGIVDGRSILEVDLSAMAEKPWRRPGSDISDWFNYGFDEISWEAYCYRRRDLGDLAHVLKASVINFSGMQEDQLSALPPEVRQMVMSGASALMNNPAANNPMMNPGVMMDMSMMGPMAMGMNGDMGMGGHNPMMQVDGRGMMSVDGRGMMQDAVQVQQGVGNGTPEQVGTMMQEGYNGGGVMGMGMGNDFGIQDPNVMNQQIYPGMDVQASVQAGAGLRGQHRGRILGRGRGFPRGRGRGGLYPGDGAPPVPVRPASPLPPGVPTGPRNQNKYKDRDGNAAAMDGLDYGGTNKDLGGRTSSGEPEDRMSGRKRRSSPGLEDMRGSKRR